MLLAVQAIIAMASVMTGYAAIDRAREQREVQAMATVSRLTAISEAAQRYAAAKRLVWAGAAEVPITTREMVIENYLPEGVSELGPYGDPIRLIARQGAYGHYTTEMTVSAPRARSEDLRLALATADRGGGQISIQAREGAARFRLAGGNPNESIRMSGAVQAGDAQGNNSWK